MAWQGLNFCINNQIKLKAWLRPLHLHYASRLVFIFINPVYRCQIALMILILRSVKFMQVVQRFESAKNRSFVNLLFANIPLSSYNLVWRWLIIMAYKEHMLYEIHIVIGDNYITGIISIIRSLGIDNITA